VRAAAYGIPGVTVDGNDVRKIYEETSKAIERGRRGEGATLLECIIQRWTGHSMSDPDTYRTEKEREEAREKDPVLRFKRELIAEGLLSEDEYMEIEQRVKKEIEEAIHYAEYECSNLDPEPLDILRGVYAAS
jgi:TPP-dependent pyruvate/acetoin dehydrogenase alpha subunit